MLTEGTYREKDTHAGLKVAGGSATDLISGNSKPVAEIDETKYEKMNLITQFRDILQGIKQHGLGNLTKIE